MVISSLWVGSLGEITYLPHLAREPTKSWIETMARIETSIGETTTFQMPW